MQRALASILTAGLGSQYLRQQMHTIKIAPENCLNTPQNIVLCMIEPCPALGISKCTIFNFDKMSDSDNGLSPPLRTPVKLLPLDLSMCA